MGSVRRIYVEKKQPYAVHAKELKEEVKRYLGIKSITNVRVLIRYDVENLSEATYKQALGTVFQNRLLTTAMKVNLKKLMEVLFFRLSIFQDSLTREQIRQSSVLSF